MLPLQPTPGIGAAEATIRALEKRLEEMKQEMEEAKKAAEKQIDEVSTRAANAEERLSAALREQGTLEGQLRQLQAELQSKVSHSP